MALDGVTYNQGTADFQVAMVDMLLQGFQTKASKNSFFAPLKQEQVVIGVPASQKGTLNPNSGYIPPTEMLKASNYLVKGQSYENGKSIATGSLTSGATIVQSIRKDFSNRDYGTYTYSVVLKDASGASVTSNSTIVEVKEIEVSTVQEWQSGVSYKLGYKVTYEGKAYECIYVNTSNTAWTPNVVPTLWKLI